MPHFGRAQLSRNLAVYELEQSKGEEETGLEQGSFWILLFKLEQS